MGTYMQIVIGIYMDDNLIAFRSSDPIIYNSNTRDTVIAEESGDSLAGNLVANSVIYSKPRAPFLRRWMEAYKTFDDGQWIEHSGFLPFRLYQAGDPDVTALQPHPNGWLYPASRPIACRKLWFGKSVWDLHMGYGVHLYRWNFAVQNMVSPHLVRTIDTSLFCEIRSLFDNLGNDGYYANNNNPNCSSVWIQDLKAYPNDPYAAYEISSDTEDMKWVDSSGNNLHGWALQGTLLDHPTSSKDNSTCRIFDRDSYVNLPVPVNYDCRVGTVTMRFRLLRGAKSGHAINMLNFGVNEGDSGFSPGLYIRRAEHAANQDTLESFAPENRNENLKVTSVTDFEKPRGEMTIRRFGHRRIEVDVPSLPDSIPIYDDDYHEISMSWDYKSLSGHRVIMLDGSVIIHSPTDPIDTPLLAHDQWINAQDDDDEHWLPGDPNTRGYIVDNGFRGCIQFARYWANAIPLKDLPTTRKSFNPSQHLYP